MTRIFHFIRYLVLGIATLACLPAVSAPVVKLYKWIDDAGQIQYGDHIPAQYAEKGNERLSKQGLVVDTKEPAKTLEQIAEDERIAKLVEQEEQARRDRAVHDQILIDTFANEEEMVAARSSKIEAIEANVRVTRGRIDKLQQKLADLNRRAANMERSGRPVPASLTAQINESRAQIQHNRDYIESRRLEQEATRETFEADIRRFRELKAATAENRL